MKITELIESLKAMPEYMEGYNSEGGIGCYQYYRCGECT